ncbi:ABC transporter ATP-binding protein [Pedobacter sp. AW1-32]|uniref:ABC transporter ATP-binding protein n=1 Tax=Pedobacter sp. AW1-32 TaxID=3383026 RepID=UPI003FF14FF0
MIQLEEVSKHFGQIKAVNNVSFTVGRGETLALLGTSGCGKTTTLKMINKLIEADKGEIYIDGENTNTRNVYELRKAIGYVMQGVGLFPHYNIAENIAAVAKLYKWEKTKIANRTHELMHKLRLPENYLTLYPNQLSGGQQQRVGLARALMVNPPILLMDEPFGALDNVTRANIHAEFKALEELRQKTIVMVTHDVQEAFELADRICLMDKGQVVQIGTPKELLYQPENDFARQFLDNQRLSLEFKIIRLADIWPFLEVPAHHNYTEISLGGEDSVWDVLEQLRASQNPELTAVDAFGAKRMISFSTIANAFNTYQTQMKDE